MSSGSNRDGLYDALTLLFLLGCLLVCGASLLIISNPEVAFNPLPPPTIPPLATLAPIPSDTPTATITNTPSITPTPSATLTLTPSPTSTITATFTETFTPSPSPTLTPTQTPVLPNLPTNTPLPATEIPIQSEAASPLPPPSGFGVESPYPFVAFEQRKTAYTGDRGCDWLGIAGEVVGFNGAPLIDYAVEVAGRNFLEVRFSGSNARYGVSGFEINVGSSPRSATYSVRLIGQTGEAVSEYLIIETGDSCQTNLTIVQFQQQ